MLTIGSVALVHHLPSFSRKVMDFDAIVTPDEFKAILADYMAKGAIEDIMPVSKTCYALKLKEGFHNQLIHEYNVAYPGDSNALILDQCAGMEFASLDILLLLKTSHRYKKDSPHFLKTMHDIRFLRQNGATIGEELKDILKLREEETYTNKLPKLNQSKDNFFVKDESFYVWDHDDIHLAVKTLDKPAYQYFQPENSEVMTSKRMWNECSEDIKLRAGLEESYVLAIERSLVPHAGVLKPRQAFNLALMKVCTSITSGWFREYCWENYDKIQALYNDDFVQKFEAARDNGLIKPFTRVMFPLVAE